MHKIGLGGGIAKTDVDGAWHFYNVVNGWRHDFTASQFSQPIRYDDVESNREEVFADTSDAQYEALISQIRQWQLTTQQLRPGRIRT